MNGKIFGNSLVKAGFVAFALALGLAACGDGGSTNGPSNNYEDTNISSVARSSSTSVPGSSSSVIPGTDPGSPAYGTLTDSRDGQVYKTVTIGTQTWMAENLNYDPGDVSDMGDYAWSGCYENESANCSKYGRLYTWEVAMDKAGCGYGNYCENKYEGTQGVCPEGWHLPSVDEWDALFTAVGGFRTAGVKLKSVEGWEKSFSASTTGTDVYGFSALPAGEGYYDGGFDLVGRSAYFCSSTEDENLGGSRHAYYKALRYYSEGAHLDEEHKNYRRSVRCLKD